MKLIMEHYDLLQMSVSSLMMLLKQCFASMQTLQMPLHVDMRLASKHNSFSAALLEAAAVMQQLSLLASGSSSMQLDSQCLPVERCVQCKACYGGAHSSARLRAFFPLQRRVLLSSLDIVMPAAAAAVHCYSSRALLVQAHNSPLLTKPGQRRVLGVL